MFCVLLLPTKHLYHARPREQTTPPQKDISWINNREVTQITYAALYKHLALFIDCLQLCICMTSSHILAPNVYKCYQDYFQTRSIHSYPSTSSLVYYYAKVLLSTNYLHWSFIVKTFVQNFRCRHTPSTGIWWPRAVLCNIILTCLRMQFRMQWTGRCIPQYMHLLAKSSRHNISPLEH